MKTILYSALVGLGTLALTGCQNFHPSGDRGSAGLGVQTGQEHALSWGYGAEAPSSSLEPMHPNRATREPQYIPD